jgi:16S rRNA (cytidine1402-2'-O)-methyltransferase
MKKGKLYLIPNFIGQSNADHQFPAYNSQVVASLQFFFVENPKPARALIKALHPQVDFNRIELFHFDKHQADNSEVYAAVMDCITQGHDIGVLSDAGCPGIADPGSELVRWAHEKNVEVVPLVGPSSIFLTLMSSGLNGQNFSFLGYLPKEQKERTEQIKKISTLIKTTHTTYLFIETPYRADQLWKDLLQHLPGTQLLCLGVDLFSSSQYIATKTVGTWKTIKTLPPLKDRQVVFAVG